MSLVAVGRATSDLPLVAPSARRWRTVPSSAPVHAETRRVDVECARGAYTGPHLSRS